VKLRIQDNSIRFRVTLREVEALQAEGILERACLVPGGQTFTYAVRAGATPGDSRIEIGPARITLVLGAADLATLCDPAQEGACLQREWTDAAGTSHRFMAMIEKDRPASTCKKIESWIYEGHQGGAPSLVPIPGKER